MKVTRKKDGEIYVEFKSTKDFFQTAFAFVGFAIGSLIGFYALWILFEFLK